MTGIYLPEFVGVRRHKLGRLDLGFQFGAILKSARLVDPEHVPGTIPPRDNPPRLEMRWLVADRDDPDRWIELRAVTFAPPGFGGLSEHLRESWVRHALSDWLTHELHEGLTRSNGERPNDPHPEDRTPVRPRG